MKETQSWEYDVITAATAKGGFKWEFVMKTLMMKISPDSDSHHSEHRWELESRLDLIIITRNPSSDIPDDAMLSSVKLHRGHIAYVGFESRIG